MAEKKKQDASAKLYRKSEVAPDVQEAFDKAADQGFFGTVPDETPNENYTLSGVVAGKPTPENGL